MRPGLRLSRSATPRSRSSSAERILDSQLLPLVVFLSDRPLMT